MMRASATLNKYIGPRVRQFKVTTEQWYYLHKVTHPKHGINDLEAELRQTSRRTWSQLVDTLFFESGQDIPRSAYVYGS